MPSFSILVRELISASRRKRYYWARAGYLVILFFFILTMWVSATQGGVLQRTFGSQTFAAFAITQFILILLVTPAACVDLLASERRRGTLDLLLVSSQSAVRIVWNKLLSRFLFAELLILSSLAAVSFISAFGGVTLDQVFRIVVALSFTALTWCSLGILFSTQFRAPHNAAAFCYILMVLGAVGAGFADELGPFIPIVSSYVAIFSVLGYAGSTVLQATVGHVVGSVVVSCLALLVAAIAVRRVAEPRKSVRRVGLIRRVRRLFRGKSARDAEEHPQRPVRGNPVAWRELYAGAGGGRRGGIHAGIAYAAILLAAFVLFGMFDDDIVAMGSYMVMRLLWLGAYLAVMRVAASSFAAERESKTLEVLLVTPLTSAQILKGKLVGIFWNAAPRVLVLIAAQAVLFLLYIDTPWHTRTGLGLVWNLGTLLSLFFAASLGLYFSLRYEGATAALVATIVTYLVLTYALSLLALFGFGFALIFSFASVSPLVFAPILKGIVGLFVLRLAARKLRLLRATPSGRTSRATA